MAVRAFKVRAACFGGGRDVPAAAALVGEEREGVGGGYGGDECGVVDDGGEAVVQGEGGAAEGGEGAGEGGVGERVGEDEVGLGEGGRHF